MSFTRESRIKSTRKPHRCIGCDTLIEVGSPASCFAQFYDGEFCSGHFHTDCRDAEVAWNDLHQTWGDEWNPLHSIKECGEDDDHLWLLDEYPSVAARLKIGDASQ